MLNLTPKKTFILLLTAFVMTVALARCSNEKALNQPGIGSINGIRIVIPAEYKLFPVEYEGDEIWENPPQRHRPGPDVPIRSFSILLHFPDYAPLNSENRISWVGRSSENDNSWIDVGVDPLEKSPDSSPDWFSGYIERMMKSEINGSHEPVWFFERSSALSHGLIHERKMGPDYTKMSIDNVDVFYDVNRSETYVVCGAGAGGPKFCHQRFVMPELGGLVDVHYARENLPKWKEIQDNVKRLIGSFIERQ
jgi:hypothetical protein